MSLPIDYEGTRDDGEETAFRILFDNGFTEKQIFSIIRAIRVMMAWSFFQRGA